MTENFDNWYTFEIFTDQIMIFFFTVIEYLASLRCQHSTCTLAKNILDSKIIDCILFINFVWLAMSNTMEIEVKQKLSFPSKLWVHSRIVSCCSILIYLVWFCGHMFVLFVVWCLATNLLNIYKVFFQENYQRKNYHLFPMSKLW